MKMGTRHNFPGPHAASLSEFVCVPIFPQAADTQKRLVRLGGQAVVSTPEEASAFLRSEHERWKKTIHGAGIS